MNRTVKAGSQAMEYELIRTGRKSMEIRVLSRGRIRVFAPSRARLRDVDAFVLSRRQWIEDAIRSMDEYVKRHALAHPMEDGASLLYEGKAIRLRVAESAVPKIEWIDGALLVSAPDCSADAVRAQVKGYLIEAARAQIARRLEHFVPLVGRAPRRVFIRDQKTRWGSCSSGDNLNFNYKLIMAPPEALDYVVVHELCHLYEFNHSEKFWRRVESVQRDYEVWKRWLKDNGRILGV